MICICVGTRPNFIKAAPIIREMEKQDIPYRLLHTGQHFDDNMSAAFFRDLDMPQPHINLHGGVPDWSPTLQIAHIMMSFESYLAEAKPDLVMVLGDVDSSLACALVAKKMGIRIAHVEAGERSGDRTMPEEINRILIDEMADILFCASEQAFSIFPFHPSCHLVGNVMIDQLRHDEPKLKNYATIDLAFAVLTLHRQSNVDDFKVFAEIWQTMQAIAKTIRIFFPVHPRTLPMVQKAIGKFGKHEQLIILDPLPRLDFMTMVANARFVMTDSGGLQVETSYLNVPCLTLRENTEWSETISRGSNFLTGTDLEKIFGAVQEILYGEWKQSEFKDDPFYGVHAAEKIVGILKQEGYK